MRIIIEEYPYPRATLKRMLPDFDLNLQNDNAQVKVGYVGYCYSPAIKDCVFFLPKVILNEGSDKVFGDYDPKLLLDLDDAYRNKKISQDHYDFLYGLSVWLYRAIKVFKSNTKNDKSNIVAQRAVSYLDGTKHNVDATIVDIILSLIKFYNDNQDFFMFIIKNIHSGYNKINWRKTISSQKPLVQRGKPIYMNPVNKKKQINFDEELLVIFYSILNYINKTYGFCCKVNCNYELIDGSLFEAYRKRLGKKRLKEIKYKYFSDTALHLWELCYSYFECSSTISSSNQIEDFLIATNFNLVFEAIIDELIGSDVPKGLQEQRDGKIVDHIYSYESLVRPESIYYIGDSKYYKIGGDVGANSVYKQFTYAKNVIQYNFDLIFGKQTGGDPLPYRDDLTEGYNITPNFFISADIREPYSYRDSRLEMRSKEKWKRVSKQFENRLFDRDTLWLTHYDINFLYILALYGRANAPAKIKFKEKARKTFRDEIIKLLNSQYDFYLLPFAAKKELQQFVNQNFKLLLGKLYHYEGKLVLALEKKCSDYNDIVAVIKQNCEPLKFNLK